ncbi:hypothetical protein DM860_015465 [Cuscuta australis]|uniref:Acyl-CoA oxidase/dehydrogenase middle domain-containing protein n=1 Tax=Cuscuta australis TaxID=267555 RepID=A0A328E781_9ASTE|nr:hypothetical protein DM860_015465 [Cuscuta australis]
MDVSVAFPQATTASKFPQCTSDYYEFDDLLTPDERNLRYKVRECMEKDVAPIMSKYWEKAEFPFGIIPKLGALKISGGTIKGYGCPGLSITASAVATAELARVDASCSTFILVHSSLAMLTISLCGSEMQKQKYLPSLARLDSVACWALTEPDYGSDASSLKTIATKVDGGWVIEGQKRWIGNSTFADVLVIFARNTSTNQINGFIIKKGAPGLQATKIENKIGLRMVQNGDILLNKVFVPDEDRLPGVNSFQDTNKVSPFDSIFFHQKYILCYLNFIPTPCRTIFFSTSLQFHAEQLYWPCLTTLPENNKNHEALIPIQWRLTTCTNKNNRGQPLVSLSYTSAPIMHHILRSPQCYNVPLYTFNPSQVFVYQSSLKVSPIKGSSLRTVVPTSRPLMCSTNILCSLFIFNSGFAHLPVSFRIHTTHTHLHHIHLLYLNAYIKANLIVVL